MIIWHFKPVIQSPYAKTKYFYALMTKVGYVTGTDIISNSIITFPMHKNKICKRCAILIHKTLTLWEKLKKIKYWKRQSYKDVIPKSIQCNNNKNKIQAFERFCVKV